MRGIERLSRADFHGGHGDTPSPGAFFVLRGPAGVGSPAAFGFVGTEILVAGAVHLLKRSPQARMHESRRPNLNPVSPARDTPRLMLIPRNIPRINRRHTIKYP